MESIEELAGKLKGNVGKWEEEVFKWTCSLAQEVAKVLLESIDEELMRQKRKSQGGSPEAAPNSHRFWRCVDKAKDVSR